MKPIGPMSGTVDCITSGTERYLHVPYMRLGSKRQPTPEFGAAQVQQGDLFLLCSDGFWGSVDPQEVGAVMAKNDLEAAGKRLVQLARERGGDDADNITVAMAQLNRVPRKFGLFS